ncbi:type IV secretion system protein [Ralstonia solanacearum]|uniref:type IV secretion system protein n=1 Tax=Ralstonia solanacearum TaxID=305 RepID=UPI0023057E2D|nr:type IV secretion system protein [Ralstonia solanacearum]MDB0516277.1 type IV secretion system protein [Ralstonia solanacearum]
MGIATIAEQAVDGLLATFVTSKSAAVAGMLTPVAITGVTIYIMVMGYAVMRGEAQDSLHTVLWKWFKISFIAGIALSAGEYQGTVIEAVTGVQGAITSAFGANSLGGVIDNALAPYEALGNALWSESTTGTIPNFALLAAAGMVSCAHFFIVLVALGMYLMAKISLAMVLAVGPIFILCAMFPATQRFTEQWIAQAVQFSLVNGLLAAAISMLYTISQQFANHVQTNTGNTQVMTDTLMLLGITAALCVVVLNIQGIASALSGGVGLQGIGRELGQQAMRLMQRGGSSKRSTNNQISNTGGSSSAGNSSGGYGGGSSSPAAAGGGASGGHDYVPLYQRNVLDNIRRANTR